MSYKLTFTHFIKKKGKREEKEERKRSYNTTTVTLTLPPKRKYPKIIFLTFLSRKPVRKILLLIWLFQEDN